MPLWFVLIVVYQIKHWVADYPLQNRYMLGKFKNDWSFLPPLISHVFVHGALTFLITFAVGMGLWAIPLALFDAIIHFMMDRIKASAKYLGRFKPLTAETALKASPEQWRDNDYFWWSLGFDQAVHHITHYMIILYCITHLTH